MQYRYIAADLVTGALRDEIPLGRVNYSHVYNNAGKITASIGVRHKKATRANLGAARTKLYVERDGVIVGGFIIWLARPVDSETLQIDGEGLWSYFRRRRIRQTLEFTATDQLTIARSLITHAQTQPGGDVGIVVGSETSGVLRDRRYNGYERKPYGEAVEQLSAVIGGFDFAIESAWENGQIVDRLRLYYPRRGRRTGIVLEHGKNATILPVDDGTNTANLIDALGAGEGDKMVIGTAADTSQLGTYPLLEDDLALKDITTRSVLIEHARRALAARAQPNLWAPDAIVHLRADTPIGSWITGDEMQVIANDGWNQLNGWHRIVEWGVDVDHEANTEVVTMAFASADAFGD